MDKKGALSGPMAGIVMLVFSLFLISILVYAFVIAGVEMIDTTTDAQAQGVVKNLTEGASTFAGFSPSLWIMVAVGALITIVLVSFGAYLLSR